MTPTIERPLFLIGAERSGTTLLRLMLDHHPQIAFFSEFEFAVDRLPEAGGWPPHDDYLTWLRANRVFRASGLTLDPTLDYPRLMSSFLLQKRDHDNKPHIGATVHRHFHRLLRIWPHARFIHLIRDGRDVARSCIGMGWAGNVWTGVTEWIDAERLWERTRDHILPGDRIDLRYEDLVLNPRDTLARLCAFIGVPFNETMLSYADSTTYQPPDPALVAQWRRKLSPYELRLVEARIADMLTQRGYELSGHSPLRVGPALALRLRVQDTWARFQFRVRRYGLPLTLADTLTRRLRLTRLQARIRDRRQAIDIRHLK